MALVISKNMWYKIQNNVSIIFFSDKLMKLNPDLTTDLCAEIITTQKSIGYWELLNIFRDKDCNRLKYILKDYSVDDDSDHLFEFKEDVVGAIFQKKERKNKTSTYFISKEGSLFVTKISNSNVGRRSIINEKVKIGAYLEPKLAELINCNNNEGFENLFLQSISHVFDNYELCDNNKLLQPIAIDCIARNTVITANGFDFFDLEYEPKKAITKSHFLFRSALLLNKKNINKRNWSFNSPFQLYLFLCNYYSIQPNVSNDIMEEIEFRKDILVDGSLGLSSENLNWQFYNTTPFFIKIFRHLQIKIEGLFN